jgi:hypothetical protein
MVKTQIQLEQWQYEGLKRISAHDSRSMSAVVREAVTQLLRRTGPHQASALEDVAGKYVCGEAVDLKDHDRGWVESIR